MDQNSKIEKLNAELQKNNDKIAGLKARNKEISRKIKELQNTRIIGMFEALNMTPDELAALAAERQLSVGGKDGADEET